VNRDSKLALHGALARPQFEVVPLAGLEQQIAFLPPGSKVTVTCSPTRGLEPTLRRAERLMTMGFQVVPHISGRLVGSTRELADIARRLEGLGLREVFVIGGDSREEVGPFASALDLLRAMSELRWRPDSIGIAAYPEHHPFMDAEAMQRVLLAKQPFASYMVTQICFDPRRIIGWLAFIRQRGVRLPVYIGIPGVVDTLHLARIAMKIGVGDSLRFLSKSAGLAARLVKLGGYHPDELLDGIAPHLDDPILDIAGIHINTFNQVENTERWREERLRRLNGGDEPGHRAAV
jgi:methylenetetrahydrofolate reductase (NADPH)